MLPPDTPISPALRQRVALLPLPARGPAAELARLIAECPRTYGALDIPPETAGQAARRWQRPEPMSYAGSAAALCVEAL